MVFLSKLISRVPADNNKKSKIQKTNEKEMASGVHLLPWRTIFIGATNHYKLKHMLGRTITTRFAYCASCS